MQCGRLPNRPVTIATVPTLTVMPSLAARAGTTRRCRPPGAAGRDRRAGRPTATSPRRQAPPPRSVPARRTPRRHAGPAADPRTSPSRSTGTERPGSRYVSGRSRRVGRFGGAAVFGVNALGLFKLVFEDDDAAGGLDGDPVVDKFPGAGRDPQLVAGVATVTALGAERGDQAGFADGAEEALGGAEQLGGPAHRVCGIVVVVGSSASTPRCQ